MNVILFGPPGSGKGTQAKMLSAHFKLANISLGDILRKEVRKGSLLGKKVKDYMESGALVPDRLVSRVIEEKIDERALSDNRASERQGILLDGFPRNLNQAKVLDGILKKNGKKIDTFLYLATAEKTIIDRLSKRRVCKKCGANYHLDNLPPAIAGICDRCKGCLVQRGDDKPKVIKKRWQIFQEESKRLLDFYSQSTKLIEVDGEGSKDEVFKKIIGRFND